MYFINQKMTKKKMLKYLFLLSLMILKLHGISNIQKKELSGSGII